MFNILMVFISLCFQDNPKVIRLNPVVYENLDSLILDYSNSKVIATDGDSVEAIITISNVKYVYIKGNVRFDGNFPKRKSKYFIKINAPVNIGKLRIDTIQFDNLSYFGLEVLTSNLKEFAYDSILINKYTERDGVTKAPFPGDVDNYGIRLRGAHRNILINEVDISNYGANWLQNFELPHYSSIFINCEVDANNFPRPQNVHVKNIKVKYGIGAVSIYGATNFRIDKIVIDSLFRSPLLPDSLAFNSIGYRNITIAKYAWSSYRVAKSKVSFGSVVIKNSNPFWQTTKGYIATFHIAHEMPVVNIDTLVSDMYIIPGSSNIKYCELSIPRKKQRLHQVFNNCTIDKLVLTENHSIPTHIRKGAIVKEIEGNLKSLVK
jgi:hypothetical protein